MNLMMDANLKLQIQRAGGQILAPSEGSTAPIFGMANPQSRAPILTICGGNFDPFDFGLTKAQHEELFHSGQLCVHLLANNESRGGHEGSCNTAVLSEEARLKALLHIMHLDYPATCPAATDTASSV
jgi:hypothetical protein